MAKKAISGIGGGSCGKALTWYDDIASELAQELPPPQAIPQVDLAAKWFPHLSQDAGVVRVESECKRRGLNRKKFGNKFYVWKD